MQFNAWRRRDKPIWYIKEPSDDHTHDLGISQQSMRSESTVKTLEEIENTARIVSGSKLALNSSVSLISNEPEKVRYYRSAKVRKGRRPRMRLNRPGKTINVESGLGSLCTGLHETKLPANLTFKVESNNSCVRNVGMQANSVSKSEYVCSDSNSNTNDTTAIHSAQSVEIKVPGETLIEQEESRSSAAEAMSSVTRAFDSIDSTGLIPALKHVSNCYGYQIFVRRSLFYDSTRRFIRRATLKCSHRHSGNEAHCKFECRIQGFVIDSTDEIEVENGNTFDGTVDHGWKSTKSIRHVLNIIDGCHNHDPNQGVRNTSIPPEALSSALQMSEVSYIRCRDITRYIEDKYNITVHRARLRRYIAYRTRRNHPYEQDCMILVRNLVEMQQLNIRTFYSIRLTSENSLHSIVWSLPEWRDMYESNGILPGISVDCKSVANVYGLPLVGFAGRTNEGKNVIYMMGVLSDQTEDSLKWSMEEFDRMAPAPPNIVALDQDMSGINAARKVWPRSHILLDEWHLNINQMKNVSSFLTKYASPELVRRILQGNAHFTRPELPNDDSISAPHRYMSRDLYSLRKSTTEESFIRRRDAFEEIYFHGREVDQYPRWYNTLFRKLPQLVVQCFNRTLCGHRFLFQGSGYSECFNSIYRSTILQRKVPLGSVPLEMKRITSMHEIERERDTYKISRAVKLLIQGSGLFTSQQNLDKFMMEFSNYAIRHFHELSFRHSLSWEIVDIRIESYENSNDKEDENKVEVNSKASQVSFYLQNMSENDRKNAQVKLWSENTSSDSLLRGSCTCPFLFSSGLPCRHITRVIVQFPMYARNNMEIKSVLGGRESIDLREFFHIYWKRDRKMWTEACTQTRLMAFHSAGCGQENGTEEPHTDYSHEIRPKESSQENFDTDAFLKMRIEYSNQKALFDQIFRCLETRGQHMRNSFGSLLVSVLSNVTRGGDPATGISAESLLERCTRGGTSTPVVSIQSEGENVFIADAVRNPVARIPVNRVSTRRKRGFHESRVRRFRSASAVRSGTKGNVPSGD